MEYLRVFEAFSGYGSQSMALRRLGIDFEVVGISEIDKYAIKAYMAVHGDTPNYGDIQKIDWSSVPDFDFLTYSFPCTDISTAGQQKGLAEGSGTRSSLLWECRKAIEAKRPKYLLMENVKNLVSKKFTPYLKEWLKFLEEQGYSNYTKVLNAKDFGVPQNRERVFMVSILGESSFHFPKPFTLEKRLKDVLEKDVDESFYLSEKVVNTFLKRNERNKEKGNGFKFEPTMGDVIASSILTNAGSRYCDNYVYVVGNTNPSGNGMNGNAEPKILQTPRGYNDGAILENCPSITSSSWHENNFLVEPQELPDDDIKRLNDVCVEVLSDKPKIMQIGNIVCEKGFSNPQRGRVYDIDGLSPNIDTFQGGGREPKIVQNYRIRKLTPRECFRLMGVSEEDIDKIQASGVSKTQQYKMAGNSIVVDVLYHIFRKMFINKKDENQQLSLF